jgi:hypothetical protein
MPAGLIAGLAADLLESRVAIPVKRDLDFVESTINVLGCNHR